MVIIIYVYYSGNNMYIVCLINNNNKYKVNYKQINIYNIYFDKVS
jgi:hypothetical protein